MSPVRRTFGFLTHCLWFGHYPGFLTGKFDDQRCVYCRRYISQRVAR